VTQKVAAQPTDMPAETLAVDLGSYPYSLPELGYGYDALEPQIDAETMQLHHQDHQQSYFVSIPLAPAVSWSAWEYAVLWMSWCSSILMTSFFSLLDKSNRFR
jgi:hypothetical protein